MGGAHTTYRLDGTTSTTGGSYGSNEAIYGWNTSMPSDKALFKNVGCKIPGRDKAQADADEQVEWYLYWLAVVPIGTMLIMFMCSMYQKAKRWYY